jgi:hypothetical protein
MLHAMHYFMNHIITFTAESAEKAVTHLRAPRLFEIVNGPTLTSTLLNLQIKQAMQALLKEMTRAVLDGLDHILLGPKTKVSWASTFCVILIICLCIEAVQVASDSFAMAALRKDPACRLSRIDICHQLDDKPFKALVDIFHMAYKTSKARNKSRIGYNPIRNGLVVDENEGVTQQMVDLVNDIKQIMTVHGKRPSLIM